MCLLLLAVCMLLGRSLFLIHFCAATSRILHVVGRSLHVADMLLQQFAEGGSRPLGPVFVGSLAEGGEGSQAHYWRGRFLRGKRPHRPTIGGVAS